MSGDNLHAFGFPMTSPIGKGCDDFALATKGPNVPFWAPLRNFMKWAGSFLRRR